MANCFRTNNTPISHTYCMWHTFMTLMDAGWSMLAWSDGTTANLTGTIPGPYAAGAGSPDPIFPHTGTFQISGSSGTNGLGNSRAWALLRQPKGSGSLGNYAGTRMLVIQRGTTDLLWRIKYSKAGGFVRGVATNQNSPGGATDEVFICGSGTDASPTFTSIFSTANGTARHNVMANDGLSSETAPFGFWAASFAAGGGVQAHHAFMMDPMINGTTAPTDTDPFVFYVDTTASPGRGFSNTSSGMTAPGACKAWYRYGQPNQSFENINAFAYAAFSNGATILASVPGMDATQPLGTNAHNGNDDYFPVPYGKAATLGGNTGYKGVSSLVRWLPAVHSIGDTFTLSTTRDYISYASVALPWDASVPNI